MLQSSPGQPVQAPEFSTLGQVIVGFHKGG